MKNKGLKKLTRIGALSAVAFLLQMLGSVMGLKVAGFLEIEFSDLPALIGAFALGPAAGIVIELIKNILHCFVTTTGLVGELANFTVNGIFVFTAGVIYKHNRTLKGALFGMAAATVCMTLAAMAVNLYVMLPLYMPEALFNTRLSLVLTTITPFNFCKGVVISLITYLCYKRLKPLLV